VVVSVNDRGLHAIVNKTTQRIMAKVMLQRIPVP